MEIKFDVKIKPLPRERTLILLSENFNRNSPVAAAAAENLCHFDYSVRKLLRRIFFKHLFSCQKVSTDVFFPLFSFPLFDELRFWTDINLSLLLRQWPIFQLKYVLRAAPYHHSTTILCDVMCFVPLSLCRFGRRRRSHHYMLCAHIETREQNAIRIGRSCLHIHKYIRTYIIHLFQRNNL